MNDELSFAEPTPPTKRRSRHWGGTTGFSVLKSMRYPVQLSSSTRTLLLNSVKHNPVQGHTKIQFATRTTSTMSGEPEQKNADSATHEQRYDAEKEIKRNPHGNFKEVEASRPRWDESSVWRYTQTKDPNWKPGQGANDGGKSLKKKHISIDPYVSSLGHNPSRTI